ncbi:hypothetical protein LLG34_09120 [bacterium]|nr:hypothetical protein [bacterium]
MAQWSVSDAQLVIANTYFSNSLFLKASANSKSHFGHLQASTIASPLLLIK